MKNLKQNFIFSAFIITTLYLPLKVFALGSWSCSVCTNILQKKHPTGFQLSPTNIYYVTSCTYNTPSISNLGISTPALYNSATKMFYPATNEQYPPDNSGYPTCPTYDTTVTPTLQGYVFCDVPDKTCIYPWGGTGQPYFGEGAWAILDCTSGTCINKTAPEKVQQATLKRLHANLNDDYLAAVRATTSKRRN